MEKQTGFTTEEVKEFLRKSTMTQEEATKLLSQHVRKYYGLDLPEKDRSENEQE